MKTIKLFVNSHLLHEKKTHFCILAQEVHFTKMRCVAVPVLIIFGKMHFPQI